MVGNALNPEVIATCIFSSDSFKVLFFTSKDLTYYVVLIFVCDEVGIEFIFFCTGVQFSMCYLLKNLSFPIDL